VRGLPGINATGITGPYNIYINAAYPHTSGLDPREVQMSSEVPAKEILFNFGGLKKKRKEIDSSLWLGCA
jgi:hypothetical protein